MGLFELSVTVYPEQTQLVPRVRAWVDLDPDGELESEMELPLHRQTSTRWVGVMGFADPSPECFYYRLGIVARAGAEWALKVRDRVGNRDLLFDTDMLTSPKCWLIGSCSLRPAVARPRRRAAPPLPAADDAVPSDSNIIFLARKPR